MLKKIILSVIVVTSLIGCTYQSNVNYGKQFTAVQVNQIKKNVTTTADLLKIFGEPAVKSVISETEEKWVYTYTGGQASTQAFTMKTKSDISTHMLDLLIKNDIVINFAETNNDHNMTMSVE